MALSPNYGWSEPDNSSLVKNGAADIRTLGDAIDTSVWNVGYGQAGKNKLINADFAINQRAFTSTTTSNTYGFDRWAVGANDGTTTYSAQTFTAGAAPVAGYEGTNYARLVTTGQTLTTANSHLRQLIEDVRTFAGQTVTVSFWAQAGSGTPKVAVELTQTFGTTGSPSTLVNTYAGQVTLSTSWARYSVTVAVPSVSGKTITSSSSLTARLFVSAGSDFNSRTGSLGIQTNTFNFWGVQVEYGSKATPFQTASGGSPQAELAMCQRYYQKTYVQTTAPATTTAIGSINGTNSGTTLIIGLGRLPVVMRQPPTITLYSSATGATGQVRSGGADVAATAADVGDNGIGYLSATGLTAGGNSTIHYAASAEL